MKTIINVECMDQELVITNSPVIASGGVHENFIAFNFCEKWDGLGKTAVFYRNEKERFYSVLGPDDICEIPHEVTDYEGTMYFGVFGEAGEVTKTSKILKYKIIKGAMTILLKPSEEPTPDIYQQLLSAYGQTNEKLYKEIAERKAEIAVERERINQLSRMEEGSTTGDAELADIRVGADGKTYSNAGDAVRGQYRQLSSEIEVQNILFHYPLILDGYLKKNGDFIEQVGACKSSDYIPCSGSICILGTLGYCGSVGMNICCYDEYKNFIGVGLNIQEETVYNGGDEFTLLNGTRFIRVSQPIPHVDSAKIYLSEIDQFNTFKNDIEVLKKNSGNVYNICEGYDYLWSWYKKIIDGTNVKVTLLGDSTMAESYLTENNPNQKKSAYIEKALKEVLGDKVTVVNHGVGSTTTGDLTGSDFTKDSFATNHPNGFMNSWVTEDTDIILINYGINDRNRNSDTLSYDERLQVFENNYREFLERLYGTENVNGRPSLGRSLSDLCVILMTPNIVSVNAEAIDWTYSCREVLKKLCAEYYCALFDTTLISNDHRFSSDWSIGDNTHPAYYTNAMIMQHLIPLLLPKYIV